MMKYAIKIIGILFLAAFLFPACSDGDGDPGGTIYMGYATVDKSNAESPEPLLTLDDGRVLEIVGYQNARAEGIKSLPDQSRVYAYFVRENVIVGSEGQPFPVLLNDFEEILTKKPVYNSVVSEETVGNDPINVDRMSIGNGSGFLNVAFHYFTDDSYVIQHLFNLYVIEDHPEADENNIYLEFRHNARDDTGFQSKVYGRVSFDIREFLPEGQHSIAVHISFLNYRNERIKVSDTYIR